MNKKPVSRLLIMLLTVVFLISVSACKQNDDETTTTIGVDSAPTTKAGDIKPIEIDYSGFRPIGDESIIMEPSQWGELNTHDPAIIRAGDMYYVYSTDASYGDIHKSGVQIRRSQDLITWEYVGPAFADYANDCPEAIAHAKLDVSKNQGFWAPDVVKVDDTYRMYYSASTFGVSRSCIGLAESTSPEGPFVCKGIVVESEAGALNGPNAIDPYIVEDTEGRMYMSYGSFSGGIFIMELDIETGMPLSSGMDDKPIRIAGSRGASIEGSAIVYNPDTSFYYLFVSYGSLSSDYNVRVGRSEEVTGPYLDAQGNNLATLGTGNAEKVGTKLMGGYKFSLGEQGVVSKGYMAPGHNSVLTDDGRYYMVHHTRTFSLPEYWFTMNVREMYFNEWGWPVVSSHRYAGDLEDAPEITAENANGEYELIEHLSDTNSEPHTPAKVMLNAGNVTGEKSGVYEVTKGEISIVLDDTKYSGVIMPQYDDELKKNVISFTAMSEDGLAIWGVKFVD